MQPKTIAVALLMVLAPVMGWAQGSGSGPTDGSFRVTLSVRGTLVHVDQEQGLVSVKDRKGNVVTAKVSPGTTLKADKGTALRELSEQGELSLAHFEVGSPVKLTYRSVDWTALELKVLRS